jgi:hypothetical protein
MNGRKRRFGFCSVWSGPPPPSGYGAAAFTWLAEPELTLRRQSRRERRLVTLNFASWKPIGAFLRKIDALRRAA